LVGTAAEVTLREPLCELLDGDAGWKDDDLFRHAGLA